MAASKRVTDLPLESKELADLVDAQNSLYKFKSFSPEIGFQLGLLIRQTFVNGYFATHPTSGIVIAVKTMNDHTLFAATAGHPSGSSAGNWDWAARKERVVKKVGKSSFSLGRLLDQMGVTADQMGLPFPEYGCHGGGFPINLENNTAGPVGVILVSGLPQADDHQLIIDALEAYLPTL